MMIHMLRATFLHIDPQKWDEEPLDCKVLATAFGDANAECGLRAHGLPMYILHLTSASK